MTVPEKKRHIGRSVDEMRPKQIPYPDADGTSAGASRNGTPPHRTSASLPDLIAWTDGEAG
jgi:hypothetical protein